jgi:hypothetical protein
MHIAAVIQFLKTGLFLPPAGSEGKKGKSLWNLGGSLGDSRFRRKKALTTLKRVMKT